MTTDSPPTLKSIAELVGVSPMAVSLALRDSPRISGATRDKIRETATRLGYHPNSFATSLVSLRSLTGKQYRGTLALLNCHRSLHGWRSSPTSCRIHQGVQRRAEESGYTVDEFWFSDPDMPAARIQRMIESRGIHGVIFAFHAAGPERAKKFHDFDFSRFSCVTINRRLPDHAVYLVSADQFQAASLAFHELVRRGYRRIGLVLDDDAEAGLEQRLRAEILSSSKPPGRIPYLNLASPTAEGLFDWITRTRVDAVLAFPPDIHRLLQSSGIGVPEQLGVACIDRPMLDDGLAGVDQNSALIGSVAVDMLTSQIRNNERGNPAHQKSLYVDGQWVDGWSVRARDGIPLTPIPAKAGNSSPILHALP